MLYCTVRLLVGTVDEIHKFPRWALQGMRSVTFPTTHPVRQAVAFGSEPPHISIIAVQ
jgi:hypothetical protein